jgi:hypothetical protein
MTFEFKIENKNTIVFSIVLERKYELTYFSAFLFFRSARTVAPSSAKIGSFSETFSQCFFNKMDRPVIIQQVVHYTMTDMFTIYTTRWRHQTSNENNEIMLIFENGTDQW